MQEFWNDRYRQEEMVYGSEPNTFLREQLDMLKPGRLLLPAEGEGRNEVYAAQKGWDVLAFDFSEAGRDKAMRLAEQRGVTINYLLAEAEKFDTEPGCMDAVALIYAHLPPAVRRQLHQKAVRWLKPGGVLLLEAFHPKQLAYTSGGPQDVAMLYTADMLREDFKQLRIDLLEEREVILKEGAHHSGAGFVTRLVAKKQ
ncbi:class I SAM-dependent methyltransferase [Pontibacter saemangeumensis]|uniref:Class I SAM-dependent methyltransferase n=1 Tax=Pontibacter saemangeumensis TaxID=1084525 RepID=A0ABP8M4B9_9BACT